MKELKFQTILVPVDGSAMSMRAADAAISMAKRYGSKIHVVAALGVPFGGRYMKEAGEYERYVKRKSKGEAEKWFKNIKQKSDENKLQLETKIIAPNPNIVGAIAAYADHNNVDLIVMGGSGRTKFKKLLLGSVSSGVTACAPCPVMVIK